MSDDLTEAMAEALARLHVDEPSDHAIHIESERAAARAALDAIIAQGGVTTDVGGVVRLYDGRDETWVTVRDLIARAVATACAERDDLRAEVERLRGGSELGWSSFYAMKARAERAEAQVQRVREALGARIAPAIVHSSWDSGYWEGATDTERIVLRALDGEADR